jgi:hypothetical protein
MKTRARREVEEGLTAFHRIFNFDIFFGNAAFCGTLV